MSFNRLHRDLHTHPMWPEILNIWEEDYNEREQWAQIIAFEYTDLDLDWASLIHEEERLRHPSLSARSIYMLEVFAPVLWGEDLADIDHWFYYDDMEALCQKSDSAFWYLVKTLRLWQADNDASYDAWDVLGAVAHSQLTTLHVSSLPDAASLRQWVLQSPLPQLRDLHVHTSINEGQLLALMTHPQWPISLETLLDDTRATFEVLPEAPSSIASLNINFGEVKTQQACARLLSWHGWTQLRRLTLRSYKATAPSYGEALGSAQMPLLEELCLEAPRDYAPEVLSTYSRLPSLHVLHVDNLHPQAQWLISLFEQSPSLTSLTLKRAAIDDELLDLIGQHGKSLRTLHVLFCDISAEAVRQFSTTPTAQGLKHCVISSSKVSIRHVDELHAMASVNALSPAQWFGELRSLFHDTAPSMIWDRLTEFLLPVFDQTEVLERYTPYMMDQLNRAGVAHRLMPDRWAPWLLFEPAPLFFSLVNHVVAKNGPELEHIVLSPVLSQVTQLTVVGGVSKSRVALLLASEMLQSLEALTLKHCPAGKSMLYALMQDGAPSLKSLSFDDSACDQFLYQKLIANPLFQQLNVFEASSYVVESVSFLADGSGAQLQRLSLANSREVSWAGFDPTWLPRLQSIQFGHGSSDLPESLTLPLLRQCSVCDEQVMSAVLTASLPSLTSLHIDCQLRTIELSQLSTAFNTVERFSARALDKHWSILAPFHVTWKEIYLEGHNYLDDILLYLSRCTWSQQEIVLSLSFHELQSLDVLLELMASPLMDSLRILDFGYSLAGQQEDVQLWSQNKELPPVLRRALALE